jgi:hypothetical protein
LDPIILSVEEIESVVLAPVVAGNVIEIWVLREEFDVSRIDHFEDRLRVLAMDSRLVEMVKNSSRGGLVCSIW